MFDEIITRLEHVPPKMLKRLLSGIIWEGTPDSGTMAVTFDDGPDPDITPAVLDVCDEGGIRGTFFMLGENVERHPDIAREIVGRGHGIGNHTMTHRSLFLAPRDEVDSEIDRAQAVIEDATGVSPTWFRPPFGLFDHTCIRAVKDRGLGMVLWTVLSGDYSDDPPELILDRIDRYISPGSIVVFHDTAEGGGDMLPGIIRTMTDRARERNVRLGGVGDLSVSVELDLDGTGDDE